MEYEIEDDDPLFDESNNPSLRDAAKRGFESLRGDRPESNEREPRATQKGEYIPGESERA